MKSAISKLFFRLSKTLIKLKLSFYKKKNRRKKKILIYTDSRGHEITKLINKHNPFSAYSKYFIKNYCVESYTTPEKHTTFYDFLDFMDKNKEVYDHVICHVGVVCFASRPISQIEPIIGLKAAKIKGLFGEDNLNKILNFEGYELEYKGEKTSALLPEFLLPEIANQLNKYPNLIWVSCNPVIDGWMGNYKIRPDNLNMVNTKSIELIQLLKNVEVLDLTEWTEPEIRKNTCDNVHLTKAGMAEIEKGLRQKLAL